MIRRYLLPLLAVVGVIITIIAVIIDSRPAPRQRPAAQPAKAPFATFIAATGVIEASGGNIAVGTPVPGIVREVYVRPGSRVHAGDRLFRIDDRDLRAQLLPAMARRKEAGARLEQAKAQLAIAEKVRDKRAISVEELSNRHGAVEIADAALGGADAELQRINLEIQRRTVRALSPGEILAVVVRPGEFAASGTLATPLIVLGNERRLFLRIDVDEYDAWRVRPNASAVAFVRGNPELQTQLRFERIDPYLVPKTSLTGGSTERVDLRVLQVIYSFPPAKLPGIYVGQRMDVFIQAPPPAPAPPVSKGAGGSRVVLP
jgi:HlyD family secretion protein